MRAFLLLTLLLAACSGGSSSQPSQDNQSVTYASPLMNARAWQLGPIIDGKNYSAAAGTPIQNADGSWSFSFPVNQDGVHYVTTPASLAGKTSINLRFRVDTSAGTKIVGANCPTENPSAITLYFQRAGDDWSGVGSKETYRWWFSKGTYVLGELGHDVQLTVPLTGPGWTAVETSTYETNPQAFITARDNSDRVGFTFLNCTGLGHGAFATAPATFVVEDFWVQ